MSPPPSTFGAGVPPSKKVRILHYQKPGKAFIVRHTWMFYLEWGSSYSEKISRAWMTEINCPFNIVTLYGNLKFLFSQNSVKAIYGSYLTDGSYHINTKRTMFLYSAQYSCFPSMAKVKLWKWENSNNVWTSNRRPSTNRYNHQNVSNIHNNTSLKFGSLNII